MFTPMLDAGVPSFNVKQSFVLDKEEPIYGLGNYENGKLSLRNFSRRLMPGNIEAVFVNYLKNLVLRLVAFAALPEAIGP